MEAYYFKDKNVDTLIEETRNKLFLLSQSKDISYEDYIYLIDRFREVIHRMGRQEFNNDN